MLFGSGLTIIVVLQIDFFTFSTQTATPNSEIKITDASWTDRLNCDRIGSTQVRERLTSTGVP